MVNGFSCFDGGILFPIRLDIKTIARLSLHSYSRLFREDGCSDSRKRRVGCSESRQGEKTSEERKMENIFQML